MSEPTHLEPDKNVGVPREATEERKSAYTPKFISRAVQSWFANDGGQHPIILTTDPRACDADFPGIGFGLADFLAMLREFDRLAAAPSASPLRPDGEEIALQERRRIADALEEEGESLPCREDGEVYESAAWLVRGNFSYEEAERLELAEERVAIQPADKSFSAPADLTGKVDANNFPELQVAFDPNTPPEALAALQALAKKAETYRMRWLSCLTLEESERIQKERAELKAHAARMEARIAGMEAENARLRAAPIVAELEQCFRETMYLPLIVKGWAFEHALGISKAIIAWQFWRQERRALSDAIEISKPEGEG